MSVFASQRIDFHNSNLSKPGNLANSAVLRMLEEEEERQRHGQSPNLSKPGDIKTRPQHPQRRFNWPPSGVPNGVDCRRNFLGNATISGAKRVTWPPPPENNEGVVHEVPIQLQDEPQVTITALPTSPPALQNRVVAQQYQPQQQSPIYNNQQQLPKGPLSPIYINNAQTPSPQPARFSPAQPPANRWAPVHSPVAAPQLQPQFHQQFSQPQVQPQYNQQQQQQQPLYQQQLQQQSPILQEQYQPQTTQAFRPVAAPVGPPPSVITLRPQAPVSQAPAPVYTSQPATASLRGGNNMRGDQKWPPETVKQQTAAENEARRLLAKGPAVRPRKVKKDYSGFFAQHALNSTYPGYRAPPGTQYYNDQQPGISNF